MKFAPTVVETVGNTPLIRLNRVGAHTKATILAKAEYMNPGGSVKDRVAFQIIEDAEQEGHLQPGGTIVEATSGNTGMGLALAAAIKGYKTVFVMPDKMSEEKIKSLRAFGSRVVITPTEVQPEDPRSYYCVARRIVEETPGAFLANQYHNPSNPRAHYLTTGPEIWEQTEGEIDVFVSSAGTGGTISGTGKYLKEQNPDVKVIAVDPVGSIYYDYFRTGKLTQAYSYKVEGFGEDFIPGTIDFSVIDDVVRVTDKECMQMTRRIVREEGLYAGGSSGGAVAGAIKYAERYDRPLNIVTILCDSAARYLSKIFDDDWMREHGFLDDDLGGGTVGELLEKKGMGRVVTAEPTASVRDVVGLLKDHGISQIPVVDGGRILGIVNEKDLLHFLLHDGDPAGDVRELVETEFAIVEPANKVTLLAQLLTRDLTVIVVDDGELVGILTKIDFIDHVSRSLVGAPAV